MDKLAQFSDGVGNQSRYMTMLLKHLPYVEPLQIMHIFILSCIPICNMIRLATPPVICC
ncbi:MAG: hypothetical protein K0Q59_1436 [Paenibacillus sp.]|nr:hypothetical protein [Paenibacillus sp.]